MTFLAIIQSFAIHSITKERWGPNTDRCIAYNQYLLRGHFVEYVASLVPRYVVFNSSGIDVHGPTFFHATSLFPVTMQEYRINVRLPSFLNTATKKEARMVGRVILGPLGGRLLKALQTFQTFKTFSDLFSTSLSLGSKSESRS